MSAPIDRGVYVIDGEHRRRALDELLKDIKDDEQTEDNA